MGTGGLDLKDVAGWVTEKLSRIKLQQGRAWGLGTFEALEALALGIMGKRSLWAALREIVGTIPWLGEYDFDTLIERADDQFSRIESLRLDIARSIFGPTM